MTDESGWLIERHDSTANAPEWWTGTPIGAAVGVWSRDANRAVRFCRELDARKVIDLISYDWSGNPRYGGLRATEHIWADAISVMKHPDTIQHPEARWEANLADRRVEAAKVSTDRTRAACQRIASWLKYAPRAPNGDHEGYESADYERGANDAIDTLAAVAREAIDGEEDRRILRDLRLHDRPSLQG